MNRNINWPSTNNIHHATRREPRFLTSQIWMNQLENDMQAHGVEIVEINSAESSQSSIEGSENTKQHPWSYATKLNKEESEPQAGHTNTNGLAENNGLQNEFDGSFYFNNCGTPDTAEIEAFNQTCFNILDKLSALQMDGSLEDFDSDEARDGDMEARWNGKDNEELVFRSDLDPDKRTIWIYSYKNRRMLSEDSYELVNIPSHETISSNDSSENDKELNTSKSTRVPSPVPATHIPRLDLSLGATLPNVTEVTEPKSSESLNRKYVPIKQKPTNNWCVDNSDKTENNVTNIVNWMALSPREKRHPRHINAQIQLQTVAEIPQDEVQVSETNIPDPAIFEAKSNRDDNHDKSDENVKTPSQVNSHRSATSSKGEPFVDNATYLISPFVRRGDLNPFTEKETTPTLKYETSSASEDHQVEKLDAVDQLFNSPILKSIENLEKHNSMTKYERQRRLERKVKSAGDTSTINNLYLPNLKEWGTYLSIPGSRRSVQQGPVVDANKTLLESCVSCFRCCK
ncbi:uncharacterized protein LOC125234103 [Leguminivora glycinivorella]|uniref:uncharacterized protein LOC125234103 n=1 Tax=Leguminivora glycinivorella TaxID=1035111 RepID=UPI00200E3A36|nr:uncharacterized protein LOC125234103 [Leguminivora glycinivorella]